MPHPLEFSGKYSLKSFSYGQDRVSAWMVELEVIAKFTLYTGLRKLVYLEVKVLSIHSSYLLPKLTAEMFHMLGKGASLVISHDENPDLKVLITVLFEI